MIPKKIFQSHKSLDYINQNDFLKKSVNSWKKFKGEFEYVFHNDKQADEFMQEHFKGMVYNTYKKLPMPVMKSDLWRYCVIYKYGGIYADTDVLLLTDPNMFIKNKAEMVIAPETDAWGGECDSKKRFCQWVWSASPNSPFLKKVINLCVKRMSDEFDGITNKRKELGNGRYVLYATGPTAMTVGIEDHLKSKKMITFDNKNDYVNYPDDSLFVHPTSIHQTSVIHGYSGITTKDGWGHNVHLCNNNL